MKLWVFGLLLMLTPSNINGAATCTSEPSTDNDQQTVADGQSFRITCSTQSSNNANQEHIQSCSWEHYDTLVESNERGTNYPLDIECVYAVNGAASNCQSDSRLTGTTSQSSCSISVSNSKPDDTGEWHAIINTKNGNQYKNDQQYIDVYTYNASNVEILDDTEGDRDSSSSIKTSYNKNDKDQDWEDDKSNWETVKLICYAAGGRPQPKFTWQINNDDLDDGTPWDNPSASNDGFGSVSRSYGGDNIVQDVEATLEFTVDDTLLSVLNSQYNVDTNPDSPSFTFDIDCIVEQDGQQTDKQSIRVDVQKSYDDGNLKGSTIGIIVGCVIAVIVLVAAIALLVFAKMSQIWCFSDEEYQHKDIQSSRPRGPGPQQPQQQQRGRPR